MRRNLITVSKCTPSPTRCTPGGVGGAPAQWPPEGEQGPHSRGQGGRDSERARGPSGGGQPVACPGCPPRRPAVCLRDVAKALLGPGGRPPSPLETWGHRCPVRGTPSQASPSPCRAMRGAAAERPGDSALPSHRGWPRTPGARVPGGRGKGSLAGSHHRDHPHPRHQDLVGHEVGGLDKFVFLRDLSRCLKGGTGGVPSLHHSPVPVTCQQFLSLELGHSFNKGAGAPLAGLGGGPGLGTPDRPVP